MMKIKKSDIEHFLVIGKGLIEVWLKDSEYNPYVVYDYEIDEL